MAIVIMSQLYPRDFIGIYYDEDDDVIQRIREEIVQKKLRNYPFDMAICTDDMGELDISRTWAYGPVFYIFNKQFPFINNEKMKCVLFGDNFRRILLTNQLISHKITPDPVGTNNMYITLRATFAYE